MPPLIDPRKLPPTWVDKIDVVPAKTSHQLAAFDHLCVVLSKEDHTVQPMGVRLMNPNNAAQFPLIFWRGVKEVWGERIDDPRLVHACGEIERLRDLCQANGIDPTPPGAPTPTKPNGLHAMPPLRPKDDD